ncbi:MAG: hypothetical protein GY842_12020 [bacterium]|nr:hypothetical protein [bacterium]
MMFQMLAVSSIQRVDAVHKEFAGRTNGDLMRIMLWAGAALAVLFVALLAVNYLQQRGRHRAEVAHRVKLEAKLRRAREARLQY